MPWTYRFDDRALKELSKLDRQAQKDILVYFDTRVAGIANPRRFGKPLTGPFAGLWRYRVRDYRMICQMKDHDLIILVLAVGHRKEVYR